MSPLILITNDDGYQAAGIQALARAVASFAEVYVVAPDGARSGSAASITSTKPVSFSKLTSRDLLKEYYSEKPCFFHKNEAVKCLQLLLHHLAALLILLD